LEENVEDGIVVGFCIGDQNKDRVESTFEVEGVERAWQHGKLQNEKMTKKINEHLKTMLTST
jgi:hypothetical protein